MMNTAVTNPDKPSNPIFKKIFKQFCDITKDPYEFLSIQNERSKKIKKILKELYSLNIRDDTKRNPEILPEIILEDMDEEQIWQQIELRNNCIWPYFLAESARQLSLHDDRFKINLEKESSQNSEESLDDNESAGDNAKAEDFFQDAESTDEDFATDKPKYKELPRKTKHKKSIVDDKFFQLGEMEEFLNDEDEKERKKQDGKGLKTTDNEGIDYFNADFSDEDEENVNYKDFFDVENDHETENLKNEKSKFDQENLEHDDLNDNEFEQEDNGNDSNNVQRRSFEVNSENRDSEENNSENGGGEDDNSENEDGEENNSENEDGDENNSEKVDNVKSSFELRQERLRNRIDEFEEKALSEKPWQLKGEIAATGRPQNSLLEEVLEFESATRPAPVITEETTQRLEDLIKQRIKDKAWDDVERKFKTIQTPQQFRKQLILNQEKSKESLAQIYEKEYQQEIAKLDPNKEDREEEPTLHKEIKELMKTLFNKLDALSNFHYSPKPVAPEPKIITNIPAVNMEEVAPVAVSNAKLLAPEEIRHHAKGEIIGKSERTKTDKNRERRKKKIKQKAIHKAMEERDIEKQKLGIELSKKDEKNKMLKKVMKSKNVQKATVNADEGALKSSKAFFANLQDKTSTKVGKERKKLFSNEISAKRLKL